MTGIKEFWRLLRGRPLPETPLAPEPEWAVPEESRTPDPEPELLEAMPQIAGGSNGHGVIERRRPWWFQNGNGNGKKRRDLTTDEILNAVEVFIQTKSRIADGSLLPPGQYAAALQHFAPVNQDQLGLTLSVAAEAAVLDIPAPSTFLTNPYTMPPVGVPTSVVVQDTRYFVIGMAVFIEGLGYFDVRDVQPLAMIVANTGAPGNAPPTTIAPVGSRVNVAGMPGGVEGPPGPQGPPGDTPRTTLAAPFMVPPVGGNVTAIFASWTGFQSRMWVVVDRIGSFFIGNDPGPAGTLLVNYGSFGNMPPGETANAGAAVVATGPQGPEAPPGVEEAPFDIYPYGRAQNTWVRVVGMGGSLGAMTGPLIAPFGTPLQNGLALGDVGVGFCRVGSAIQLTAGGGTALMQWDRTSGIMSAVNLDMLTHKIIGLGEPTADSDAATKAYVDTKALPDPIMVDEVIANRAVRAPMGTGTVMGLTLGENSTGFYRMAGSGNPLMLQIGYTPVMRFQPGAAGVDIYAPLTMNSQRIYGLPNPNVPNEAASKGYVDAMLGPLQDRIAALERKVP